MYSKIKITIALCLSMLMANAQEAHPTISVNEPSISSLMSFAAIPVSNYTGVPDVSIPFTTLSSRNKNINFNVTLNYHPSSVSAYAQAGECGLGWSLLAGGMISRTNVGAVDESTILQQTPERNDYFQFNFMGNFGKFYLSKVNGELVARIRSNAGKKLVVTLDYNHTTMVINSFSIYDDKGYQYLFDAYDTTQSPSHRSAYHLSKIIDNNANELVTISYRNFTPSGGTSVYKKMDFVTVNGFGKLEFIYSTGASTVYSATMRLTNIVLKDVFNAEIKRMVLTMGGANLSKVEIAYPATTKKDTYVLNYKSLDLAGGFGSESVDMWGYKNITPSCNFESYLTYSSSPYYSTKGVLEQMVLPTGGCINYDYESNTYNDYYFGSDNLYHLDENPAQFLSLGDDVYIAENHIVSTVHDYTLTSNSSGATKYLIVPSGSPKTYYFSNNSSVYYIPGFTDTNGNPAPFKPTMTIQGPIFPGTSEINQTLVTNHNTDNKCLGTSITLNPGEYAISISTMGGITGTGNVLIKSREINPNPTTFFYGGGIRIKRIGYFASSNVPSNYYSDTANYNSYGIYPAREKNYSYNLFDKPGFSSGVAVDIYYSPEEFSQQMTDLIGYSNVTVTETPNNGREEFTYSTYLDFNTITQGVSVTDDHRRGLLTHKKVFNTSGQPVSSLDLQYGSFDTDFIDYGNHIINVTVGWSGITKKIETTYYAGASTPLIVTEDYVYNSTNRQVENRYVTNELGEVLRTEYTYHTGNSPFSTNRISEPDEIKNYKSTVLVSSSKIAYSNTFPGNQSYLPSTTALAKGTETPSVKTRYNAYDQYGHILESQTENGLITSYIWGYYNAYPVAKVENISYSNIPSTLINEIQAQSNIVNNEANLLSKLAALRNDAALATARVTTYTYIPLVGIKSVTDVNGQITTYEYDLQNRQKLVKDTQGKPLKEVEYNYKTQN